MMELKYRGLCWQGWACLATFVLLSFVFTGFIFYFNKNKIVIVPFLAVLWFIYLVVAVSMSKKQLGNSGKMGL